MSTKLILITSYKRPPILLETTLLIRLSLVSSKARQTCSFSVGSPIFSKMAGYQCFFDLDRELLLADDSHRLWVTYLTPIPILGSKILLVVFRDSFIENTRDLWHQFLLTTMTVDCFKLQGGFHQNSMEIIDLHQCKVEFPILNIFWHLGVNGRLTYVNRGHW